MKTLFQTLSVPLVLVGFALLPTISPASETRVDSTGGLTTLLDDETDNLSLFLDGNPAGLVLLNTRDRLDVSGELSYLDQEGPWGSMGAGRGKSAQLAAEAPQAPAPAGWYPAACVPRV